MTCFYDQKSAFLPFSRIFAVLISQGVKILVLTETDACCGPMAAAFLRDYSMSNEVVSAGRNPIQSVDLLMVEAMHECLIDLDHYVPVDVKTIDVSTFDVVYECPEIESPRAVEAYRIKRDFIKNEAFTFFKSLCLRQIN